MHPMTAQGQNHVIKLLWIGFALLLGWTLGAPLWEAVAVTQTSPGVTILNEYDVYVVCATDPQTFTWEEWADFIENHEPPMNVLQFYERVNDRAVADPTWSSDFRRAIYNARMKEYSDYVRQVVCGLPE